MDVSRLDQPFGGLLLTLPAYVLVTPARNEAAFIEKTIASVIAQTILPLRWVIVSDGSTDGTDAIIEKYAAKYSWILAMRMPDRVDRSFDGKALAVNAAYARIADLPFAVVGNLDADISFDPDQVEFLLGQLVQDSSLGVVSSALKDTYDYRFMSPDHVSGAFQLFRRECFEAIDGYQAVERGGVDHIAVIMARMQGWKTRTFTERALVHHRPLGAAWRGPLAAKFHDGALDYALGGHPVWEVARTMYQMSRPPLLLGGLALLTGYAWSAIRRVERPVSTALVSFRRREQMRRLQTPAARAIAFAWIALLAAQIVQPSIFNPATRVAVTAGGAASPTATNHLSAFLRINVAAQLAVVLTALALGDSRRRLRRYRALIVSTAAYGAAVIASSYLSAGSFASERVVQSAMIPLTIFAVSVCLPVIFSDDDYDVLFRGVIVVLAITAIVSLAVVVTGSSSIAGMPLLRVDQRGGALAAAGLFAHRNTIGAFLEFGPALAVYLMTRGSRAFVRAYSIALTLIGAHLMLTFSRSSQIVALISLTPLLIPARRRVRLVVAAVAAAVAVAGLVVAVVPEFRAYAALGASLTRRQDIWRFMIQRAVDHPWFGVGLQNINYLAHGVRYGPHNLFLAQLVYFGAIGLALFIVLLMTLGRAIASTNRLDRGWRPWLIVMLLVGVLLQGGVEYMLTAPVFFANSLFWICAGFASRSRSAEAYSIP